jgi:putative transposase
VLLCLDLFTKEVWTGTGLRTAYVLFAIHLQTRRIVLAEATFSPNSLWMRQMGRNLLMECQDLGLDPQLVVHDRDKLLVHELDVTLGTAGLEIVLTPFRAPDANAHAERWIGSVSRECLDHLILVGLSSLQRVLVQYRRFYDGHRPHQGIGNQIPDGVANGEVIPFPAPPPRTLVVERESFLGGLLNSYHRTAG